MSEHEGLVAEIRRILDSHTHDTGVQQAVLRVAEWVEALGQAYGQPLARPTTSGDQPPEILGPRASRGEVELQFTIHQNWSGAFSTRPNWFITFPDATGETLYLRRNGELRDSGDAGFETVEQLLHALGRLLRDVGSGRYDVSPIGGSHD